MKSLFDRPDTDSARLSRQCKTILERLRSGPATNVELVKIALKYTSRISEVRMYLHHRGETIECTKGKGGVTTYRIERVW